MLTVLLWRQLSDLLIVEPRGVFTSVIYIIQS